ncbi:hypothetical protein ACEPAI_7261 [Sanghuangporus weigelae]
MATPSSSGTSPSPALSFTLPTSASENSTDEPNDQDQQEREERRKKLIARTELAKITRALRTTLALASYKAKHNVANVPLSTLEARVAQRSHYPNNTPAGQPNPVLLPASFGNDKKRKANATTNNTNFYSSPLSQGTSTYSMGGIGLGANTASSSVSTPTPHTSYTFPPPTSSVASGPVYPSKGLFASILALPPAKRARTIHNPEAPPVPPPSPPPPPQNKRSPKKGTRKGKEPAPSAKQRAADKKGKGKEREKKSVAGRARANSISSVHTHSSFSADTENVNDTDMKAAETLTDLLFSRTGGTASPRSSFSAPTSASRTAHVGPTVGATPLSQASSGSTVAPSAATQYRSHVRTPSNTSTTSVGTSNAERPSPIDGRIDTRRSATPTATPRIATRTAAGGGAGSFSAQATPVFGAPGTSADSEAADLMLLLANSPSPARPTAPRDQDISRNAYAAGRVLFPSGPSGSGQVPELGAGPGRGVKRSLGASSISSIDLGERIRENANRADSDAATSPPSSSQGEISPPQAPMGVVGASAPEHDDRAAIPFGSRPPQLLPSPPSLSQSGPQTPVPAFRLTDYINVTPSPAAPAPPAPASQQPSSSSSLLCSSASGAGAGPPSRYNSAVSVSSPLRKSFDREGLSLGSSLPGRRLFENEPGGVGIDVSSGSGGNGGTERKMHFAESGDRAGSLGSGIDLVQT